MLVAVTLLNRYSLYITTDRKTIVAVLTVLLMKMHVFWDRKLCPLTNTQRCLHILQRAVIYIYIYIYQ